MKFHFIALALLLPILACAEDIKRADGTILKGTIVRAEPDGLVIQTDSGIEKVDFLLLSDEVQKRFQFDLAKAREYRAAQAAARQQAVVQQLAAVQARAAAVDAQQRQQPTPEEAARHLLVEQSLIFATATVEQGTSKGVRAQLQVHTGRAAVSMLDKDTRATVSLGAGFIYGLEAADGETWQGKVYPAGYYHFTTELGEESTIHAYALTVEDAISHGADGHGPTIPSVDPTTDRGAMPGHLRGGTMLDK